MTGDKTIPELDSIPNALDGTEKFVIVQGVKTYHGSVSDLFTYIQKQDLSLQKGISMTVAGKTFGIRSGTDQRAGIARLVGGTIDVANTTITANSLVFLSRKAIGGSAGTLSYTLSVGTKFTINSSSGTDTSDVAYFIIELL